MIVNLCEGFIDRGCEVDLIAIKRQSPFIQHLPAAVRLIDFKTSHSRAGLLKLIHYLRRERPDALLAAKNRPIQVAVAARHLAGTDTRLVIRLGTTISAALDHRHRMVLRCKAVPVRFSYPRADHIVAVSQGVAKDLSRIARIPLERIQVIANPVIGPRLAAQARQRVDHPWLAQKDRPVLVGMGRLTRQKDFATLIRAFALVRKTRPCRLVILGEGSQRDALQALAHNLEVAADVDLPGFIPNPYPYLKAADVFVLSSIWEGSPNVLTEAMALERPVVATDCPSGPAELLTADLRRWLVPMDNPRRMARAVDDALEDPPSVRRLQQAVRPFRIDLCAARYLDLLLGPAANRQLTSAK